MRAEKGGEYEAEEGGRRVAVESDDAALAGAVARRVRVAPARLLVRLPPSLDELVLQLCSTICTNRTSKYRINNDTL